MYGRHIRATVWVQLLVAHEYVPYREGTCTAVVLQHLGEVHVHAMQFMSWCSTSWLVVVLFPLHDPELALLN